MDLFPVPYRTPPPPPKLKVWGVQMRLPYKAGRGAWWWLAKNGYTTRIPELVARGDKEDWERRIANWSRTTLQQVQYRVRKAPP